jgi:hypothetical protein
MTLSHLHGAAKCEADLPESLRLGRVQVSCEGWTGPGDSYVLKGARTHNVYGLLVHIQIPRF